MCMKVKCNKCGKYTWQGCGMHKDQVLKDVPLEDRCQCPRSGGCCGQHAEQVLADVPPAQRCSCPRTKK